MCSLYKLADKVMQANASEFTRDEVLAREPETLTLDGEGQNLVAAEPPSIMQRLKARKSGKAPMLETRATKPVRLSLEGLLPA